jgi:hypothetical protein
VYQQARFQAGACTLLLLPVWRTYYILLLLLCFWQTRLTQRPSQSLHGCTHTSVLSQSGQSALSGSSWPVISFQHQGVHQVKDKGSSCHAAAAAAAAPPIAARNGVVCAVASVAAVGVPHSDDRLLHMYQQQQQQRSQQQPPAAAAVAAGSPVPTKAYRTAAAVRKASSYSQLLELLQDCSRDQITADLIKAVLFQASRIARSAASAKSNSSSSSNSSRGSEGLAAQQLVCACLRLLLEVNNQISGWHLANCLLSLGVLCGRGGPAAPVMAGAAAAAAGGGGDSMLAPVDSLQRQQLQTAGVLQQLINPARSSRRDLEALLQATGPQYQLQQLLHVTRGTAIAAAQPRQLVDMLYGLAVLPLRPAPEVLSLMLQGLQDRLQVMHPASGSAASAVDDSAQQRSAAAAADGALTPKQLSQLLWSAATLQVHLADGWLQQFCAASHGVLQLYGAQVRAWDKGQGQRPGEGNLHL